MKDHPSIARMKGFTLVEVLLAMLVLAVVLTGTAQYLLSMRHLATETADRTAAVGDRARADDLAIVDAWMWGGPRVVVCEWPSPSEIEVHVTGAGPLGTFVGSGGAATQVGVWIDGWFVQEAPADARGVFRIDTDSLVSSAPGPGRGSTAALVIRARHEGGPWGPPWRTCLQPPYTAASRDGEGAGLTPVRSASGAARGEAADPLAAGLVIHLPSWASIPVSVALDGRIQVPVGAVDQQRRGPEYVLLEPPQGTAGVTVGDQTQVVESASGRWVDVFF